MHLLTVKLAVKQPLLKQFAVFHRKLHWLSGKIIPIKLINFIHHKVEKQKNTHT